MKPSLIPIIALLATVAAMTEATDPAAIINLKSQIGKYVLNAAGSAIQAKQNLVRSGTGAIINAKTNFLQRQLQHLVQFKTNQINSVLELKKNLIKSKAATIGQLGGGIAIQTADVAPYSPPAAPPVVVEEHQTVYSPVPLAQAPPVLEEPHTVYSPVPLAQTPPVVEEHHTVYSPAPLAPLPPAAPPVQVPVGPYPPPSYLAKRELTTQELPVRNAHAQPIYRSHRTPSQDALYSAQPTPPPPPPARTVQYV